MTTSNDVATAGKQKTITIKRLLNLPLTTVWRAWTFPDDCKKWWGPKEYTCPECIIDFKVGGKYLSSMKSTDGKEIWSTGTYKEIIPLRKIVMSDSFADSEGNIVPASFYNMPGEWNSEQIITLEFEEVDGKTNMSLQHAGLPVEIADDCIQGWQSSFDKLESNVE